MIKLTFGRKEVMESARTLYEKLNKLIEETPVAVATVVRVRGSTPREVGTKIRAGLDVIDTGQPQLVEIDLTEEISMQSLGVCGGVMDVYIERWPAG
jgi:xanthine dehydrogenase accessory factor